MTERDPQPEEFDYDTFRIQLVLLDIELNKVLREINDAAKAGDEDEITRLSIKRRKAAELIFACLENAFLGTGGEIMNMPEFNPESDRHLDLGIHCAGDELWAEIRERLQEKEGPDEIDETSGYVEYRIEETT